MYKRLSNMAVFIEFVASSGLAVFFHWVLHYKEVGYVIFGIGILLSLATYLLREEMERTREKLIEKYNSAHDITFAIAGIADSECRAKAEELIAGAMRTIQLLQQGHIPLEETEFYLEGARHVEQTKNEVKAVDPGATGWESRGSLLNFYQANLRALERGVKINRIFVLSPEELAQPDIQKIILQQFRDGINVRIAYRDELPNAGELCGRDTDCSFDFAIYDDRVVTEVFGQAGKYFGRKTAQQSEVAKLLHLFQLIEHSSHALSIDNEAIVLATETIPITT